MASGRSSSDDRILEVIFDPEAPLLSLQVRAVLIPTNNKPTIRENLQEEGAEGNGGRGEVCPAPREVREMEVKAVKAAEEGRLDEALQLLTEAVAMAPNSASIYNNRAQVTSHDTTSLFHTCTTTKLASPPKP